MRWIKMSTELQLTNVVLSDSIISVIESAATNPDVDVKKMERLLEMHERIAEKDAKKAFNESMAKAQIAMPSIRRDGQTIVKGQLRNKFARFEDMNETIKPVYSAHGFAITFDTNEVNHEIEIIANVLHIRGHSEAHRFKLPIDNTGHKNEVQARGSTLSYGKRYLLISIFNLTTHDQDDDGVYGGSSFISTEQIIELRKFIKATSIKEEAFCGHMQIKSLDHMPVSKYKASINALKAKLSKIDRRD